MASHSALYIATSLSFLPLPPPLDVPIVFPGMTAARQTAADVSPVVARSVGPLVDSDSYFHNLQWGITDPGSEQWSISVYSFL